MEHADPRLEFAVSKSMAVNFIPLIKEYRFAAQWKTIFRHAGEAHAAPNRMGKLGRGSAGKIGQARDGPAPEDVRGGGEVAQVREEIPAGVGEGPRPHGHERGGDREDVERVDERIGEEAPVLADVGLVVGEEADREGEVERPRQADPEDEDRGVGLHGRKQPGGEQPDERDEEGVEREKVRRERDQRVVLGDAHAAAGVADLQPRGPAAEQHRPQRVRQLVAEHVGPRQRRKIEPDDRPQREARHAGEGVQQRQARGRLRQHEERADQRQGQRRAQGQQEQSGQEFGQTEFHAVLL